MQLEHSLRRSEVDLLRAAMAHSAPGSMPLHSRRFLRPVGNCDSCRRGSRSSVRPGMRAFALVEAGGFRMAFTWAGLLVAVGVIASVGLVVYAVVQGVTSGS